MLSNAIRLSESVTEGTGIKRQHCVIKKLVVVVAARF
jgi:hypothetical protein